MHWIMITKPTMFVILKLQNSHLLTLSLPTEDVFQVNGWREMLTPKHECVTFGFSFSILVFFPFWESLNLTVCQQYVFFRVLTAMIRGSTWPSGAKKASDVSAADWLYQHTWKKYDTFSRVLLRLFSGPEIPVEHRSLCAKVTYPFLIIV